jgi:hypothetical protein
MIEPFESRVLDAEKIAVRLALRGSSNRALAPVFEKVDGVYELLGKRQAFAPVLRPLVAIIPELSPLL